MRINFKIFVLGLVVLAGCKKYDNPPPVFEELKSSTKISRNILIISIDGVGGDVLKTVAPPNINSLLPTSKYTYSMFKSAVSTDAASWTSMLTGASYPKHLVSTDDFQGRSDGASHDGVVLRNNFISLINIYKTLPTAIVTPWPNLRKYLSDATLTPEVSSDLAAKDNAVQILQQSERLGAMVVNFREAEAAGANGGYTADNVNYKNSILAADGYVKEVMEAVKKRKNYSNEDWLVVITTNHGGSSSNPTAGFIVVNYPTFKTTEFKKDGYNSVLFSGTSMFAAVKNDNGLYDAANDKDFTVQAQIRVTKPVTGYVGFLSKGNGYPSAGKAGWTWGTWVSQWRMYHVSGFNSSDQGDISDGSWHTLTTTVKRINATTRTAQNYFDGVPCAAPINWGTTNLSTTEQLRVGFRNNGSTTGLEFYIANLAYFQTALDASVIKANLNLKDMTKHPNYNTLIGFWKMDEGAEGSFQNTAPIGYDMVLSGNFSWTSLGANGPSQSTFESGAGGTPTVVTSADVGAIVLYWMGLNGDQDLDGKAFLKDYELEFLKQ